MNGRTEACQGGGGPLAQFDAGGFPGSRWTAGMKRRQEAIIDALVKVTGARTVVEVASAQRYESLLGARGLNANGEADETAAAPIATRYSSWRSRSRVPAPGRRREKAEATFRTDGRRSTAGALHFRFHLIRLPDTNR